MNETTFGFNCKSRGLCHLIALIFLYWLTLFLLNHTFSAALFIDFPSLTIHLWQWRIYCSMDFPRAKIVVFSSVLVMFWMHSRTRIFRPWMHSLNSVSSRILAWWNIQHNRLALLSPSWRCSPQTIFAMHKQSIGVINVSSVCWIAKNLCYLT
jgi:hypothetical protein